MGYTPNEIAIGCRDKYQQNHWVYGYTIFRQTHIHRYCTPYTLYIYIKSVYNLLVYDGYGKNDGSMMDL